MSRQSKIEQIRKESIQRLNEERLKKLHQEYRDAPFISEAKDNVAPGAAAAGAAGGGSGLGIAGKPWEGLFTRQFPDVESGHIAACEGEGGYDHHLYSKSGLAFRGIEGGPNPEGEQEATYTDAALTKEVYNEITLGWDQLENTARFLYVRREPGHVGEWGYWKGFGCPA